MAHNPIYALIFDAEGVVINTMHTVWIPADVEFCKRHGKPLAPDLHRSLVGSTIQEGTQAIKQYFGLPDDVETLHTERMEIIRNLFRKKITFIAGVEDFIAQHQTMRIAVATSLNPEFLALAEQHLSLGKLFDNHVYDIYTVGVRSKPNPDIFLYAAEQLGVAPRNCVVFEDAPNGIEAARRAGMRSVGLTTTFDREHLAGASTIVGSFKEVDLTKL